jgi:hypothetical protein
LQHFSILGCLFEPLDSLIAGRDRSIESDHYRSPAYHSPQVRGP